MFTTGKLFAHLVNRSFLTPCSSNSPTALSTLSFDVSGGGFVGMALIAYTKNKANVSFTGTANTHGADKTSGTSSVFRRTSYKRQGTYLVVLGLAIVGIYLTI